MGELGQTYSMDDLRQDDPTRRIPRPFRLPKKDEGLRVRFVAARNTDGKYRYVNYYNNVPRYEPFFVNFQAYYPKRNPRTGLMGGEYVPCTCCGGRLQDVQCAPHQYLLQAPRGEKKRPMPMPHFAIHAILLGGWHKVRRGDWDETTEKQREWEEWAPCTRQEAQGAYVQGTCEGCDPQYEVVPGRREYLNPGLGGWTQLLDYDRQIGNQWCTCGKGRPFSKDLHCATCGRIFIDTARMPVVDAELMRKPAYCPVCKANVRLIETLECRIVDDQTGQNSPGCKSPQRAGIFDVDLHSIYTVGKEKDTKIQIAGWSAPRPIPTAYTACLKPWDFEGTFKIGPEAQARMMGVANPFREATASTIAY